MRKPTPITSKTTIAEMAAIVCEALKENGIDCFLSGGAVVSIYTENRYESFDLDFVTLGSRPKIKKILEEMGFSQEKSRHFIHPNSAYFVEFPGSAIRVGEELVREFQEFKTSVGVAKILRPTDCVKDRLAAFYHWNDRQGLEQAVWVAQARKIDLEDVRNWSKGEGYPEKFEEFLKALKTANEES